MKRLLNILLNVGIFLGGVAILGFLFWPFASKYLNASYAVGGDYIMHLANVEFFRKFTTFPVKAWQGMWFGGYPIVEGYPWLHYYLIQPLVSYFKDTALAMEYYSIVSLFLYYLVSFVLFYFISKKNKFLAIFYGLVILFGADAGIMLFYGGFFVFVATQFLLPLCLLVVIEAREKENPRLLLLGVILLSLAFYLHASMTGILFVPAILPFIFVNREGKITSLSLKRGIFFFIVFALTSGIMIYQSIDQSLHGLRLVSPGIATMNELPGRFVFMFSWMNPLLLPISAITFITFFWTLKRIWRQVNTYFLSFALVTFVFLLMVFRITGLVVVLLAERAIWAVSLTFLVFSIKVFTEAFKSKRAVVSNNVIGLLLVLSYSFVMVFVKPNLLVPKTPFKQLPEAGAGVAEGVPALVPKYSTGFKFPEIGWNKTFDNYRTDGLDYLVYSWWPLISSNSRYFGWFPQPKGLRLDWSGLVSGAEYGLMGEAGTPDNSQFGQNQSLFFLDWYGIRHLQAIAGSKTFADYLKTPPIFKDADSSGSLIYYNLDPKLIGPMYAPTNAKTLAVVAPSQGYFNIIKLLSYSKYSSQKLIPVYLGSSLGGLNKTELKNYDAVFLYGYGETILSQGVWNDLSNYVSNGGSLLIDTGQQVGETESLSLPVVFPVSSAKKLVITSPWIAKLESGDLTKDINQQDFQPLKYKYLPFNISAADSGALRQWAKPLITKDGQAVAAYGFLGSGKIVWSGLNLPFQAIDNRNLSEITLFSNFLDWSLGQFDNQVDSYVVEHPNFETIKVSGNGSRGVLIKENYNAGWVASLNGKPAKIFTAGLLQMYVPVPEGTGKFNLVLTYVGAPVDWFLFAIGVLILLLITFYLIVGNRIFNLRIINFHLRTNKTDSKVRISEEDDY